MTVNSLAFVNVDNLNIPGYLNIPVINITADSVDLSASTTINATTVTIHANTLQMLGNITTNVLNIQCQGCPTASLNGTIFATTQARIEGYNDLTIGGSISSQLVYVSAGNLAFAGQLSANGLGNPGVPGTLKPGSGPGAGPCSSGMCGGGGYGGSGGASLVATTAGGVAYGTLVPSLDLGSSGCSATSAHLGGAGGGAIYIETSMRAFTNLLNFH